MSSFFEILKKSPNSNARIGKINTNHGEISTPAFQIKVNWTAEDTLNYLNTWSAVKHYEKAKNESPLKEIEKDLKMVWKDEKREVSFPVLLRLGKKKSFSN